MWLEVGTNITKAVRQTPEERQWLRNYLSFPNVNAHFSGGPDRIQMVDLVTDTFPSGYVPMVCKAAKDPASTGSPTGFPVELLDRRVCPAEPDPDADLAWLYDYQLAGVQRVYARKRGILWLRTGAGKTEIAVALARSIPTHWLFIVHRTSLGVQAAERFELRNAQHGVDLGTAGVIGEGKWAEGERFTCATFQSLARALAAGKPEALALMARTGGLIVDECHVLPAMSYFKTATACPAYYRVGLSGTPLARGDQRSIYALGTLGPVIYEVKPEVLIAAGVLAKPRIRMLTCVQPPLEAPWAEVYQRRVVRSAVRNDLLVRACQRATPPILLFVKEVAHGKALTKMLINAGVRADFVWGKHSTEWRKTHAKRLVQGHFDVLVCSVIFQEGVDIPSLRSVIIGSGGKSVIASLQRIGRGMRVERDADGNVKAGGDEFEVYDIFDVGHDSLEQHAKDRRRAYTAEGYETITEPSSPASLLVAKR